VIELRQGNLLDADVDALVNTVNTVGVMGKGVALQFKRKYPDNFRAYEQACKAGQVEIGKMLTFDRGEHARPRFILNFPTKKHWRQPSKLDYIDAGLVDLVNEVRRLGITSIAVPALGCSNGGLAWSDVKPRITKAFEALPDVRAVLFMPRLISDGVTLNKPREKPNLTLGRALMVQLIDFYREPGYSLGKLEAQKLAYFLQEAGQPLKLDFVKNGYGPYAEAVNHVLQRLEGHYTTGYGDRSTRSKIQVVPSVFGDVQKVLDEHPDAKERLERVKDLIEGFETPYGMELLASLHWLNAREGIVQFEDVGPALSAWSKRKPELFAKEHIAIAWQHLKDRGWLRTAVEQRLFDA